MRISGLLLLFVSVIAGAQTVKVVNFNTSEPVSNAYIINQKVGISLTTNQQGAFQLPASLDKSDTIRVQHQSFYTKTLRVGEITDQTIGLTEKSYPMKELVVSATRWEQERENVPNKIAEVDQATVEFQNPQTTADLVGLTGQVHIQKSQLGGGSPMIRGFATNRVLLVVDGVRMNNAIFRGGNLQNVISLDAHSIENTEVIFGPGSMLYGSDAIGGVMSFQTLDPKLSADTSLRLESNGMIRYSTANQEKTGHLDFNIGGQKWASLTSISYSDYDHQRMGKHGPDEYLRNQFVKRVNGQDTIVENPDPRVQQPTGYNQLNLLQKVKFQPNQKWNLQYGFNYSTTSNIPRYDRLTEKVGGQFRNAEWYYGPQKWMMHNLNIQHQPSQAFYDKAKLTLAYQDYTESRHDREFRSPWMRHRVENVKIPSVNLDLTQSVSENHQLFYGVEAVYNKVFSKAQEENIENGNTHPIGTRYPDGSTWQSYAGYLMWKGNFSKRWSLTAGVRYNQVLVDARLDTTFYPFPFTKVNINTGAPTGNLGIVYRPGKDWRFRLNGATGFRAPNIDDAGKVFDSEPGKVLVPNPNLSPEYAYNLDLGITKNFASRVTTKVTGYYTILTNAMVRRFYQYNGRDSITYDGTLSQVQTLKNVGQATIYGVQASLYADLWKGFKVEGHYRYTYGRTSDGEAIRHVAPPSATLHLKYTRSALTAALYAQYHGKLPYSRLAPSERGKPHLYATNANGNPYSPSWYTLNLKAGYHFNEYLQLQAGVENILNTRYRPYSSGIAAPGRNFTVTLRGRL